LRKQDSGGASRPTCISLFSGCGGLDLGLKKAGFRVLAATDNDPIVARAHAENFPGVPFICKRIGLLSVAELRAASGLKAGDRLDLLAGGPPCPPFSKSRFYRKDMPRSLKDPVAAETIGGYMKLLKELRPRAFILENVKGLAYGVHRDALKSIRVQAERMGYAVSVEVLNAADFGVPQIRERCIVIGSLEGRIEFPRPTHAKEGRAGLEPWVVCGKVLRDLDTKKNASDEGHFAGGQHHGLLRKIPPGDNYLFFTKKRGHRRPVFEWRSRYWSFLLKLSPNMPSWTIQARRSNNMGPFHWRNRILRISEIKRLQTFPDAFQLAGTVEQQWRQIGNAVPPLLAQKLGKAILEHFLHAGLTSRQAA
jgi:DNA (cytosine-5)-methyltransferase 1